MKTYVVFTVFQMFQCIIWISYNSYIAQKYCSHQMWLVGGNYYGKIVYELPWWCIIIFIKIRKSHITIMNRSICCRYLFRNSMFNIFGNFELKQVIIYNFFVEC